MCRIAGSVSTMAVNENIRRVDSMVKAMRFGGPDGEGIYFDKNLVLGHCRRAILDLTEAGNQPMKSDDESYIISFNGQIYNYKELRSELEANGIVFRSESDTEVLLYGFKFWGTSVFNRLEGIFAFAIYEKTTGTLFLVRDQFGVKPLYYCATDCELVFASEVRAFKDASMDLKENGDWKVLFLAFGSLPHPHTTYENVYSLAPGSYIRHNTTDFTFSKNTYYHRPGYCPVVSSKSEALQISREAIHKSVAKNLVADVPVGVFLSGGIDSSQPFSD